MHQPPPPEPAQRDVHALEVLPRPTSVDLQRVDEGEPVGKRGLMAVGPSTTGSSRSGSQVAMSAARPIRVTILTRLTGYLHER